MIYVAGSGENGVPLGHCICTNKILNLGVTFTGDGAGMKICIHFEKRDCLMEFMSGFS